MWNDLTMQQRADVISMAVKAGMRDIDSIRSFYNESVGSRRFEDGGIIDGGVPFEITVTGKDRRPAWKRMYQNPNLEDTSRYYNGDAMEDAVSFVPGLGDAVDVAKAADAVNRGNYLEAGILGAGLLLPNIIEKPIKAVSKTVRKLISKTRKTPIEKSNLMWDAEQMFKDGNNHSYTQEDIDILNSHIPEYKEIEKAAKANGTYLKMPDGSIWKGDPREWVIAQSKNVKANYGDEILTHGNSDVYLDNNNIDVTGKTLGKKLIWTSTNPYLGGTYGNKVYRFVIPKGTNITTVADAKGRYWKDVKPNTSTNDLVYPNITEDNVVRINNVVDRGPFYFDKQLPKSLPNESFNDYYKRVFTGDDLTLGERVVRKALLGNNGTFNINDRNIFKGLIPVGLGAAYGLSNERADGGSIHIAPSKRGTFTAAATKHGKSVQEFASQVLSHPENYSLTMRRKANFARNFGGRK